MDNGKILSAVLLSSYDNFSLQCLNNNKEQEKPTQGRALVS